tara:strand:+ start:864 stop:1157 length:294 start_codon:yes stop_codon:yes gene_type:complete
MKTQDETNLNNDYLFGLEAEKVLENKAYQFALTSLKGDIFGKLVNTPIMGDNEEIVELVRSLQSIEAIHGQLENIMRNGTFSRDSLISKDNDKTRFK